MGGSGPLCRCRTASCNRSLSETGSTLRLADPFYPVALSVHVVRKATVVGRVPAIIEGFGFRTMSQRVASHPISLSEPAIATGEPPAHVTQVALAEYVGSARKVVSKCLRSLSDDGTVAIGRGWVRITDEAGLQRLADQS